MLRTPALGRAVEVAGGPAGRGRMAAAPRALSCCLGPRRRSRFRVQLRPSGAQGSRSVAAAGVLVAVLGVGVVGVAVGAPVAGGGVRLAGVAVLDGAQGAGTGLWGGGEEGGRGGGGRGGVSTVPQKRLPLRTSPAAEGAIKSKRRLCVCCVARRRRNHKGRPFYCARPSGCPCGQGGCPARTWVSSPHGPEPSAGKVSQMVHAEGPPSQRVQYFASQGLQTPSTRV